MFASLKAKLLEGFKKRQGLYIGIASAAAGAQGGPLAAKGVEYAAPYVVAAIVKALGG